MGRVCTLVREREIVKWEWKREIESGKVVGVGNEGGIHFPNGGRNIASNDSGN